LTVDPEHSALASLNKSLADEENKIIINSHFSFGSHEDSLKEPSFVTQIDEKIQQTSPNANSIKTDSSRFKGMKSRGKDECYENCSDRGICESGTCLCNNSTGS